MTSVTVPPPEPDASSDESLAARGEREQRGEKEQGAGAEPHDGDPPGIASGWMARSDALLERDGRDVGRHLVADAPGRTVPEVVVGERPAQAGGADATRRSADRQQADQRADGAVQLDHAAERRATWAFADERLDAEPGPVRRARAAARWRGSGRAARRPRRATVTRSRAVALRGTQRELEIGRVLVRRVGLDRDVALAGERRASRRSPSRGRRRRDRRAARARWTCSSPESAAITNASRGRLPCQRGSRASPPANTSTSIAAPVPRGATDDGERWCGSLRRHDPDQVLTVGGCVPPSQPGAPDSRVSRRGP